VARGRPGAGAQRQRTSAGTLRRDGAFTTTPRAVGGGGEVHMLQIADRLTRTALAATVAADVARAAEPSVPPCRAVGGAKRGAPNTIPGG
jgi:hypothetical protein